MGTRGRWSRRRATGCRAHRRRSRTRGQPHGHDGRRPPVGVEAGLRWTVGGRELLQLRATDGDGARRRPVNIAGARPRAHDASDSTPRARTRGVDGARRRPRSAGHRDPCRLCRCRRQAGRVPPRRAARDDAGRRAGRHSQGHRQGLAATCPPGGHHRAQHRPAALHRRGLVREVQSHGGCAGGRYGPRREQRHRGADLGARRRRHRRRMARCPAVADRSTRRGDHVSTTWLNGLEWLAVLRIGLGLWWLESWRHKDKKGWFERGTGIAWAQSVADKHKWSFVRTGFNKVVAPRPKQMAYVVVFSELLIGLGLVFGLLTPIAAVGGLLLNLLYFVMMIHDWAEQGQNLMMVLIEVVVLGTHAWQRWSLDNYLGLFV